MTFSYKVANVKVPRKIKRSFSIEWNALENWWITIRCDRMINILQQKHMLRSYHHFRSQPNLFNSNALLSDLWIRICNWANLFETLSEFGIGQFVCVWLLIVYTWKSFIAISIQLAWSNLSDKREIHYHLSWWKFVKYSVWFRSVECSEWSARPCFTQSDRLGNVSFYHCSRMLQYSYLIGI